MMRTVIVTRFAFDGVEVDTEADGRLYFFLEKRRGRWGICLCTVLFDMDKMVPVHPGRFAEVDLDEVGRYPS